MTNCPKCSRPVSVHSNFCVHCYTPIVHTKTDTPTAPYKPMWVTTPGVCPNCAASLDEDSKFCPSCRTPITFTATVICPECEKSVNAETKFCKYCAADLTLSPNQKVNASRRSSSQVSQKEKAERLAISGAITAIVSAVAFFWGYSYINSFSNMARAGLMNLAGQTDQTYTLAQVCVTFGAIGFIIGVVLFIVGMAQR